MSSFNTKRVVSQVLNLTIAVSIGAAFSACGVKKNMDEMHDATVAMNDKMDETNKQITKTNAQMGETEVQIVNTNDQMGDTKKIIDDTKLLIVQQVEISRQLQQQTQELDAKTAYLKATSEALYKDLRQGNSLTIRSQRLQEMERTPVIEAKILEAGEYFMAYEFQLFKFFGFDNSVNVDNLKNQAIEQFSRDVRRYMHGSTAIEMKSPSGDQYNLYALAVAMHRINPNEEQLIKDQKVPQVTIMHMIESALDRKAQLDTDPSKKLTWEHQVLTNEGDMVYMLQLRANFLAGMVLEKISGIQEVGDLTKVCRLIWSYDVDLTRPNLSQLQEYESWMSESVRVKEFLTQHGYSARIDGKTATLFRNMNVETVGARENDKASFRNHAAAQKKLFEAIDKFRK
jgi:hypothetical protein